LTNARWLVIILGAQCDMVVLRKA